MSGVLIKKTPSAALETPLCPDKMAALECMAGAVVHDMGNILSAIMTYASFLQEDIDDRSLAYPFVQKILEGGKEASSFLDDLGVFSRCADVSKNKIDMGALASLSVKEAFTVIPDRIRVGLSLPSEKIFVNGDEAKIKRGLALLCQRACAVTGGNDGEIFISLSLFRAGNVGAPPTEKMFPVELAEESDGALVLNAGQLRDGASYVSLMVSNTGPRMTKAQMENLCVPFSSDERKEKGIGMAYVYGVAALHHGALAIRSVPDEGTSFSLLLPVL